MNNLGRKQGMKSAAILIPVIGLSYFAAFAVFLILLGIVSTGSLASYQIFFIPLASVCALSAIGIWYKPTFGYVGAASISMLLILIFFLTKDGNDVITVLSNPNRNILEWVFYLTTVPTFFSSLISSVVGLVRVKSLEGKKVKMTREALVSVTRGDQSSSVCRCTP